MALVSRELNPNRSLGLDAFRGLTMAGMILVSNPGGPRSYAPLEHAEWNGWTPTDLVFPSFAFALGVALALSLSSQRSSATWRGRSLIDWIAPILGVIQYVIKFVVQTGGFSHAPAPALGGYDLFYLAILLLVIFLPEIERRFAGQPGQSAVHVVHHGLLIFALGFFWTFDAMNPAGFRTLGVLQRLGIVYLATGLIVLACTRRGQIAWAFGLLACYWILMKYVPVPGIGAGVLTMEGNLAGYIDRVVLGRAHMYTPSPLPYWDPEGLLGAIPAIATGLLGSLAGGWMRTRKNPVAAVTGLLITGAALLVGGLALSPWFPINKNLWSPTLVLFAGGADFMILGACARFADVPRLKRLVHPLVVLGANSILIYLLSGTLMRYAANIPAGTINGSASSVKEAAYHYLFASWLNPYNASLLMALAYVAAWIGAAAILYRRRIFVKI